jgi:hypothetical protein
MLYNQILNQVNELKENKLTGVGFVADMLCLSFGNLITRINIIGDLQTVGEFTLHVQCIWRFIKNGEIILTYRDLYNASINDDSEVTNKIFVPLIQKKPLEIIDITLDEIGTLQIKFNKDIIFDVFPDRRGKVEHWRFINNITHEHIVIFPEE